MSNTLFIIHELRKQVEFQNSQISMLIKTVHELKNVVDLQTEVDRSWNNPFEKVDSMISELEFNQGIEE
jgi:hypothetical protein